MPTEELDVWETTQPAYEKKYMGRRAHLLDPGNFKRFTASGKMTGHVALTALRAILSTLQIRFTMASPIDVGGGQLVTAGSEVPRYFVSTVELQPDKYEYTNLRDGTNGRRFLTRLTRVMLTTLWPSNAG